MTEPKRPCRRHEYGRSTMLCGCPGPMVCVVCAKPYNPEASRRGRNARSTGLAKQRNVLRSIGLEHLPGNAKSLDGKSELFRAEHKTMPPGRFSKTPRIAAFPEAMWSLLRAIPVDEGQVPILVLTDKPGAGGRTRSLVVLDIASWRSLHGEGR